MALPAIIEAFDIQIGAAVFDVAAWYSVGLISLLICYLMSYFSCIDAAQSLFSSKANDYFVFYKKKMTDVYSSEQLGEFTKSAEVADVEHHKYHRRSLLFEVIATILALISLACFIGGSFSFLYKLDVKHSRVVESVVNIEEK